MSGIINLRGSLEVGGSGCGAVGACGGLPRSVVSLALGGTVAGSGCGCSGSGKSYEKTTPPVTFALSTSGSLGANFTDVTQIEDITEIGFLYLECNAPVVMRIGAEVATLSGIGGTFPTSFVGSETLLFTIDGVSVTTTFTSGDQTALQCAARINAAIAYAGVATPRVSVNGSGQLVITSINTGPQGTLAVTGGSGRTALGFAGTPSAVGSGSDVDVAGIFLAEFDRNDAPARLQLSGIATVTLVCAGK